jgi:hypothetical protein
MTQVIKAIPTRYKGYHFRSRLEARWAVFFDVLDIKWEYEPEGFDLPSGRYLPDFRLPETRRWIEVKGATPSKSEIERCFEFAERQYELDWSFFALQGDIPDAPLYSEKAGPLGIEVVSYVRAVEAWGESGKFMRAITRKGNATDLDLPRSRGQFLDVFWMPNTDGPDTLARLPEALRAARSARFEHGESGAT